MYSDMFIVGNVDVVYRRGVHSDPITIRALPSSRIKSINGLGRRFMARIRLDNF